MVKLAQNSIRSTELSIAYSPCCSIVLMCYNSQFYGLRRLAEISEKLQLYFSYICKSFGAMAELDAKSLADMPEMESN